MSNVTIGVLALQGDFQPHINHFLKLEEPSLQIKEVRDITDLNECDGLVIPGGESTTLRKCFAYNNDSLFNAIKQFIHVDQNPVWGTCAGCVLLSKKVENIEMYSEHGNNFSLGGLEIVTSRNFYGCQNDSFICSININSYNKIFNKNLRAICIRAPYIKEILSDDVEILATFSDERIGSNVVAAVEQNNCIGTVFHPELTPYSSFHQYFYEKKDISFNLFTLTKNVNAVLDVVFS